MRRLALCLTASVWRIRVSVNDLDSIIVNSMQQRMFEVHTPFRFEAVDTGTKTAREYATYASSLEYISSAHANALQKRGGGH